MDIKKEFEKITDKELEKIDPGMRIAIYCRVSTQDQTLEQQKIPLIERCKREGWFYEIFEEKISGAKDTRPELDAMLKRLRNKEFNAVMIYKLDRLGRSLQHLLQLVSEFENKDIQFICFDPVVDTKTAQGRFFLTISGAFAELEREMTVERTQSKINYIKGQIKKNGFYITKAGKRITALGRQKGTKDKKRRVRSGYHLYHANKKKKGKQ